jgi:hypothetical protein
MHGRVSAVVSFVRVSSNCHSTLDVWVKLCHFMSLCVTAVQFLFAIVPMITSAIAYTSQRWYEQDLSYREWDTYISRAGLQQICLGPYSGTACVDCTSSLSTVTGHPPMLFGGLCMI